MVRKKNCLGWFLAQDSCYNPDEDRQLVLKDYTHVLFLCLRKLLDCFLVQSVYLGGRGEISFKLSSYYSPMLVVKCGCGSTVLSPASIDQFKRLIPVFSLVTKQFGDTTWRSVGELRCALGAGSFLFRAIFPYGRVANPCVLCPLHVWAEALSVCQVWWLLSQLTKIAGPLMCEPAWKRPAVFPASGHRENGWNAGSEPQAWNVLYFSVFISLKRFSILILFIKK